jgi:hypothetical protein
MSKPNPGSPEAKAKGCKCPVLDNDGGRGNGPFWVRDDCPAHGGTDPAAEEGE